MWTKTSRLAKTWARSSPRSMPVKSGVRKLPLERRPRRPVPHDHQPGAGHGGHLDQPADLLLGRQPADVPDGDRPGFTPGPPGVAAAAAVLGAEDVEGDAAAPQVQVGDAEADQLVPRRPGGNQGPVGAAVDTPDPPADWSLGSYAVLPREAADVGLVHGHRRDPEPTRGPQAHGAQGDRRRQVHHVGTELGQRPLDGRIGHAHGEGAVARHRE